MDIPVTIATVVALEWSERIPAYIDEIQTFIFFGEPSELDTDSVYECASELIRARTDDLSEEEIAVIAKTPTAFNLKEFEFTEGQVSIRWETRL